ncbi:hypothetical protein BS17DRAFT_763775 [Gyrodon lividus]|nr:hypothetical protein BS17DRAFT_763775 [Gyrodon lividus]
MSSIQSHYFLACNRCPTGDICMVSKNEEKYGPCLWCIKRNIKSNKVIHEAGLWQKFVLKTQRRTYKSPEFVPSSANEEFGPPNDSPKPKAATAATNKGVESKITAENIGKEYSVYDSHQPRKRIGAVVKVKARQHGEVDGTSLNSQLINFIIST